jgi:hypothetical protein
MKSHRVGLDLSAISSISIWHLGGSKRLHVTHVALLHLGGEAALHALQQVVQALGAIVVRFRPAYDLPLRIQAQGIQKRDGAIQHLGHATAARSGVELQQPQALKLGGCIAERLNAALAEYGDILFQRRRGEGAEALSPAVYRAVLQGIFNLIATHD